MLQLTKRTEYGLIALTHLAQRAGSVSSVREICERYIKKAYRLVEASSLARAGAPEVYVVGTGAVLPEVPGVAGLLRAGRGEPAGSRGAGTFRRPDGGGGA